MTTITKEQVDAAIKELDMAAGIADTFHVRNCCAALDNVEAYIAQLEANQRQPVSDEKLREAVESAEFAPESMFGSLVLLPKQQWDVITSALSELETLRAKNEQLEERVKVLDEYGTEIIKHDGCEGCEDWNMMKFHDAREKFRSALAGGKVGEE